MEQSIETKTAGIGQQGHTTILNKAKGAVTNTERVAKVQTLRLRLKWLLIELGEQCSRNLASAAASLCRDELDAIDVLRSRIAAFEASYPSAAIGAFALSRRRWHMLAVGVFVLAGLGLLIHHNQHLRSTRQVIADLHSRFEKHDPDASAPMLRAHDQNQLPFAAVLAAFFSLNRRQLPADVQGFRFGSSMDEVSANCLKQYGQHITPISSNNSAFVVLIAQSDDPTSAPVDRTRRDSWEMVFGFYQARLVYMSKTYRFAVDRQKTSDYIRGYFKVNASDVDLLDGPDFFETDNYVGFLGTNPDSSTVNAFYLFDVHFLRDVLDSHFRNTFKEFVDTIGQTDFNGRAPFGGDVYVAFRQFPSKYSNFDELKLNSEQAEKNRFNEGMPMGPCAYLATNFRMLLLQTLFPPLSGTIQRAKEDLSNNVYYWQAEDRYFVTVHEDSIEIGRHPETPNPDRL